MDGQPIRLKYGESETFSPGGGITGVEITKISAKAKNIAFIKEVALHYQQANGTWTEKLLAWNMNFGDYDLFSLGDNTFDTTTFVLRYSAAGQIFWDNRNGANYPGKLRFPKHRCRQCDFKHCAGPPEDRGGRRLRLHDFLGRGRNLREEPLIQ